MKIKVLAHPTAKQMTKKILKLKKKYPEGTHWGDGIGKYGKLVCDDFANMVCKYLYRGNYRSYHYGETNYKPYFDHIESYFAYEHTSKKKIKKIYNMIEPGDQLISWAKDHTVIVVKKSGNKLILAEGNYKGKVHWGDVMTEDEFIKGRWHVIKYHKYKWKYNVKEFST